MSEGGEAVKQSPGEGSAVTNKNIRRNIERVIRKIPDQIIPETQPALPLTPERQTALQTYFSGRREAVFNTHQSKLRENIQNEIAQPQQRKGWKDRLLNTFLGGNDASLSSSDEQRTIDQLTQYDKILLDVKEGRVDTARKYLLDEVTKNLKLARLSVAEDPVQEQMRLHAYTSTVEQAEVLKLVDPEKAQEFEEELNTLKEKKWFLTS